MNILDGLWHLLNFFAPALGVGLLASALAKLLWRRPLRAVRWSRLARWCSGACALTLVAGLLVFGRDGKMATYGAMCVASAFSLWWVGLRSAKA